MNTVIVDLVLGDSGKGKIIDYLMKDYDICVKYSGGPNSGATIVVEEKKYKLHHLPAGLIRGKPSYIASTCLINPDKLISEIENLKCNGFDVDKNLKISPNCHIITKEHIELDTQKENSGKGVGSTKQGISPCSQSKYSRTGIRLFECEQVKSLKKYFADISCDLNNAIKKGKNILFQSTQGTLLDIEHGFYPYVSTTNNVAGAAASSCGIGPQHINKVIGIFKAYTTYVGNGPFLTEIKDEKLNDYIANKGYEYGTTTGRRRRIGWLDIPLLKYAINVNGCTELAMMKYDVLSGIQKKMCVSYKNNDRFIVYPPAIKEQIFQYEPLYVNYSSGSNDIDFLEGIEEQLLYDKFEQRIRYISTGPERNQIKDLY